MLDGNVHETPKDERDICLENDSYRVALPMNVSWPQGMAICGKLGSGRMAEVKDIQDLEQAQLGVPHSRIQVELDFILQAGTCQIINFA